VAISAGGVLAMGVLVALAVRADSQAPSASPWLTAMDVAVGLAFVAAGLVARGPVPERVLVAAVGPAWLAGSFLIGVRSLHQAVLAVALVAFPAGRVRGAASWLLVGLAGLAVLQWLPQLGVAALFAGIAAAALARWRTDPATAWYPAASAAAVAAVLAWVWWIAHRRTGTFDATVILVGYELVLWWSRAASRSVLPPCSGRGRGWPTRCCPRGSWSGWTGWPSCSGMRSATVIFRCTGGVLRRRPIWTGVGGGWRAGGTGAGWLLTAPTGRSPWWPIARPRWTTRRRPRPSPAPSGWP
jgi:hypothetical protein